MDSADKVLFTEPQSLGPLAKALAAAQAEFPPITRDKTVTVTMKTGGSYKFSYAPLDSILAAVRGPLAKHGLAIAQLFDRDELVTMLLHESGGSLTGRVTVPSAHDVQGFGSSITYLRRYAIQALLGIAAEEDDDGNHAVGGSTKPAQASRTPAAARPRPAATPPPADEPAALTEADQPIPKSAPNGIVQCESKSPFGTDDNPIQCRREMGHPGPHKTPTESWPA